MPSEKTPRATQVTSTSGAREGCRGISVIMSGGRISGVGTCRSTHVARTREATAGTQAVWRQPALYLGMWTGVLTFVMRMSFPVLMASSPIGKEARKPAT